MRKKDADHGNQRPSPVRSSQVGTVVRLVVALALVLWSSPSVDASHFARLMDGMNRHAGLALLDPASPFTLTAGSSSRIVAFEARSPSARTLVAATGGASMPPAAIGARALEAGTLTSVGVTSVRPCAFDGQPFAARAPPREAEPA